MLSGKRLYQINNIVDINNFVSLEAFSRWGPMILIASAEILNCASVGQQTYKGIGKDIINIESLPVFADADGPFGSPTSDSERAMVRAENEQSVNGGVLIHRPRRD